MVDLNPILQQVQHLMPVVKEEPLEHPPPSSPALTQPPPSSPPVPAQQDGNANKNLDQTPVSLSPPPEVSKGTTHADEGLELRKLAVNETIFFKARQDVAVQLFKKQKKKEQKRHIFFKS